MLREKFIWAARDALKDEGGFVSKDLTNNLSDVMLHSSVSETAC